MEGGGALQEALQALRDAAATTDSGLAAVRARIRAVAVAAGGRAGGGGGEGGGADEEAALRVAVAWWRALVATKGHGAAFDC